MTGVAGASESLVRAFPARLASVVTDIAKSLPEARFQPTRSVTTSLSRTWPGLVVTGESVLIPYRIYNPEPSPRFIAGLSRVEELVAAGIYFRHHDGFIRRRWLGTLLDADQPWVAPFIVQLLGEYVIEICRDIERFARSSSSPMRQHLSVFLNENRCYAALTRQRAMSYWSRYYRYWHPSPDTYPALVALSMLPGSTGR